MGGFYLCFALTFVLGAMFLGLEISESVGMLARGAGPSRSAFLSAFFCTGRIARRACYRRPPMAQLHGRADRCKGSAGLAFALLLTGASFMVSRTDLLWPPGVPAGLTVLAIAQMGVHLVFFLHIGTGPDHADNVLALAFGVLIVTLVVSGSLWIMANLNANMLSPSAMMEMQR